MRLEPLANALRQALLHLLIGPSDGVASGDRRAFGKVHALIVLRDVDLIFHPRRLRQCFVMRSFCICAPTSRDSFSKVGVIASAGVLAFASCLPVSSGCESLILNNRYSTTPSNATGLPSVGAPILPPMRPSMPPSFFLVEASFAD